MMICNENPAKERPRPTPISSRKLLFVEGKDEINLFCCLLENMGIRDIDIREGSGKDKFKEEIPILCISTGFSDVNTFLIVRDADADADGSFQSVRNILLRINSSSGLNLCIPENKNVVSDVNPTSPKIGIFIMPGNSNNGMLEDLCLATVKEHEAMSCVETFSKCSSKLGHPPRDMAKAKAQVFLASMSEIVNLVGLGAKKKYWDFSSNELNQLRSFLGCFQ